MKQFAVQFRSGKNREAGRSKRAARSARKNGHLAPVILCALFATLVAAQSGVAGANTVHKPEMIYGMGAVNSVAISPDGTKFLHNSGSHAVLRNSNTGLVLHVFSGHLL